MSLCYSFITHIWDKSITFNSNSPVPYLLTLVKENNLQLLVGLPLPFPQGKQGVSDAGQEKVSFLNWLGIEIEWDCY